MQFSGSGDTRKGVCLRMSVAELMEQIGVNEGYNKNKLYVVKRLLIMQVDHRLVVGDKCLAGAPCSR